MIRHKRLLAAAVAAGLVLLVTACKPTEVGTGLLLWSLDEAALPSGSVMTIQSESELNRTYTLVSDALEQPIVVPIWRVQRFDDPAAANHAAARYREVFDGSTALQARAGRTALPLRSSPASLAENTVYRMREGEVVKLINRQDEITNIQGLVSYWYEALTETGVRGWVFGYTLSIFDPTDPSFSVTSSAGADPLADLLLQNTWRPIWFADMIRRGAIDLEVFDAKFGLFPRPEDRQFELVLPWHATVFEYERLVDAGSRRYVAEGTTLRLTFQRNDELSIQYTLGGRQFSQAFQRVDGPIEEYVERELDRRRQKLTLFLDRGPSFVSDNYGQLTFSEDQRFTWTGFERLVPRTVPAAALGRGRLDLGVTISRSLQQTYDGAIGFRFDGTTDVVTFVYSFQSGGIQFVHVPTTNVEERVVIQDTVSPLTIFMSAQEQ